MLTEKRRKEIYKLLNKIYYDLSKGGAYTSPTKLYQILKARGIHGIGKYTITKWLQNQDDYSFQKPARKSFKKPRVVVNKIDQQYDMDLIDFSSLSKHNRGITFLLIVIDIFSRYLWVQPLKNKTGREVVKALDKIFSAGRVCQKLRSDNGKEFVNKVVQAYLKSKDIYHFTSQNSPKANYAERVIKTIKGMIFKYFQKKRTYRYIDVLDDIVKSYNLTPHKSLNYLAPKNVTRQIEADLWAHMYLKPSKIKGVRPFHFKRNDLVRVSYTNMIFKRSYDEQFSKEVFKITKRFRIQNIPQYKIRDMKNELIKGNFHESELLKIEKDQDALWLVEKVLRKRKRNGLVEYLCKFEGFDNSFNQWIPEKDVINIGEGKGQA